MKYAKFFIALLVIGIIVFIGFSQSNKPGKYGPLTQCLKDKGALFYGAFWCPHCQKQKSFFGADAKTLPYVECSTPDGKDQTQICKDKGIESYPTWIFADGSRITGEQKPEALAQKTGCEAALSSTQDTSAQK